MKKMNAYQRIVEGKKKAERDVLAHIRKLNKEGEGYQPMLPGQTWRHTLDRLEKEGRIKFYPSFGNRSTGYWIAKKGSK